MWSDNYTPGCFYDTRDCVGNCCKKGKEMLRRYFEEKYEEEKVDNQEIRKIKLEKINEIQGKI